MITVTGRLPLGLVVDGQTYRDFTLRVGTLRDTVETFGDLGVDASPVALRYGTLARRLSFEGFAGPVTCDHVMSLVDRDGMAIENAASDLEKKLDALSVP